MAQMTRRGQGRTWLGNLAADTNGVTLVATAIRRWITERDDDELKQEPGLEHHEGRGWRRFPHHTHVALPLTASGSRTEAVFPPVPALDNSHLLPLAQPEVPPDGKPRGVGTAPSTPVDGDSAHPFAYPGCQSAARAASVLPAWLFPAAIAPY